MIKLKTQQEIEIIAEGGKILARILKEISQKVKPGVGTSELNKLAEQLIFENKAKPSFKGYQVNPNEEPFPTALCTSINQEIVHAPAEPNRLLQSGDIIGLDLGLEYKSLYTDTAVTVPVGKINQQSKHLLKITRESLEQGIRQFKEGNTLADVGQAIEDYAKKAGYSVVRELIGHGVGHSVHEEPKVPNYYTEEGKTIKIERGLVVAIEPMVNIGQWQIKLHSNGFTFVTKDNSLSAQFEHTVALDHFGKTRILTQA